MSGLGRVLVVEDEIDLREMISTRLRGSGYEVVETGGMREAVHAVREHQPDVILLDIGLPDGDGFAVLETIRQDAAPPSVIFLTALGTPDNRLRGLYGGAVDFLTKPVDLGELVARVAATVRQRRALDQARLDAERDALTGLRNRRALMAAVAAETVQARRSGHPFAVVYLDADNLKLVNDRHGHAGGDAYLLAIAGVLSNSCRKSETPARVGGDEFAVLLHEASATAAREFVQRVRDRLADARIELGGRDYPVSVSIGSAFYPEDGDTPDQMMAAADRRMYEAKRNRPRQ